MSRFILQVFWYNSIMRQRAVRYRTGCNAAHSRLPSTLAAVSPPPAADSAACHEDARVERHGGTHARGGGQGESGCDDQPEGLGEWHEAALGD